ncbi:MAG: imidazole glycerol phosphate synthase subunit HisH [Candidatus Cyclobacteriaceae bacterium M3_2C_046]
MKIAIVKYNAGNVQSVKYALQRLGIEPVVTNDQEELEQADKIIFPGVGEAASAMKSLRENNLINLIPQLKQPFLGVCLGLQLMCRHSEERDTPCLGIFDLDVKKFEPKLKVPHMGWNKLDHLKSDLFKDMPADPYVYFVHSYYAEVGPDTIATAEYMHPFSAAIRKDNFYAIQAHPEKSGEVGAQVLKNFLAMH